MDNVTLPVSLSASYDLDEKTITLPITLPIQFSNEKMTVRLPITLPMRFKTVDEKTGKVFIAFKETVNLDSYQGTVKLPYKEVARGITTKIPFKETAWKFDGLIMSERVLSPVSQDLTLSENVQALILVDFELLSTNTLKLKWYGSSVPSFTIMKKSAVDETYTADKQYSWNAGSATLNIESEDYNIYLQGSSNSGTSAVYTIAGVNDVLVIPDIEVLLNEKIIEGSINYTSEYRININY